MRPARPGPHFIDGQLFGTHDTRCLPERPRSIDFNHWLIDLNGQTGTAARPYDQKMDHVLHVKDRVLTPAQVSARVNAHGATGTTFEDTARPERLTPETGALPLRPGASRLP